MVAATAQRRAFESCRVWRLFVTFWWRCVATAAPGCRKIGSCVVFVVYASDNSSWSDTASYLRLVYSSQNSGKSSHRNLKSLQVQPKLRNISSVSCNGSGPLLPYTCVVGTAFRRMHFVACTAFRLAQRTG